MSENRKNISMNLTLIVLLAVLFHLTACSDLIDPYIIIDTENEMDIKKLPSFSYEDNELKGTVAYKYCDYGDSDEEQFLFSPVQFPRGEAYLFKDFLPDEMRSKVENRVFFIFESSANITSLWFKQRNGLLPYYGTVCNFPEYAKAWDIPTNGCKVYYEGISYKGSSFGAHRISIYYVLTTLNKK